MMFTTQAVPQPQQFLQPNTYQPAMFQTPIPAGLQTYGPGNLAQTGI